MTAAGKKRYGVYDADTNAYVSAKKIQTDFNRLNQTYANAAARKSSSNTTGMSLSGKAIKKWMTPEQAVSGNDRLSRKMQNTAKRQKQAESDMKNIESLQWKILAKAAQQGYTVHSKQVSYYGKTGKSYVRDILLGPIASTAINISRGDIEEVRSHKISVTQKKKL